MLNREQLLSKKKFTVKPVSLPDSEEVVYVRVMSGTERDRWEECQVERKFTNFRSRFVVATLCNAEGTRLCTEADVDAVGELPMDVLDPIFEEARSINKLGDEDIKAIEKK